MKVSQVRVGAVVYAVTSSKITFSAIDSNGGVRTFTAGDNRDLIAGIGLLNDELSDGLTVAHGNVPHLRSFISDWGRRLLPPGEWFQGIDVLVLIPQGDLHGVPLHLVSFDDEPLGAIVGITYASSLAQYTRCVERNAARKCDLAEWTFDESPSAPGNPRRLTAIVGAVDVLGSSNDAFKAISDGVAGYAQSEVLNFGSTKNTLVSEFTRTALKTAFRRPEQADILCVVAHGYIDHDNCRMSGLLLARDRAGVMLRNIPLHGGRYFDFRDLPLRHPPAELQPTIEAEVFTSAELAIEGVLSSEIVALLGCSTAVGRVFPGDEPASLAESFLHIGACSVLATVWDADLAFVRECSDRFFGAWINDRMPKALALRKVLREMRATTWKNRPERFGCIVLKGDWL